MITLDTVNYLVSVLTAKNHLGIESSQTANDSSVVLLINAVSLWCKEKAARQLRQSAIVEYRDGTGDDEIRAKHPPLVSLSVYIDTSYDFTADTQISESSMIVDASTGLIFLKADIFPEVKRCVKLGYNGGFADPENDCPDMAVAALFMIKKLWDSKSGLIANASIQGGSVSFIDSLAPEWVLDTIARYRLEM